MRIVISKNALSDNPYESPREESGENEQREPLLALRVPLMCACGLLALLHGISITCGLIALWLGTIDLAVDEKDRYGLAIIALGTLAFIIATTGLYLNQRFVILVGVLLCLLEFVTGFAGWYVMYFGIR